MIHLISCLLQCLRLLDQEPPQDLLQVMVLVAVVVEEVVEQEPRLAQLQALILVVAVVVAGEVRLRMSCSE